MLQTKLSAVVSRSQGHSPEAEGCPALGEVIVFLSYFDDHLDARQAGKVEYPLDEVLFMYLLAALAGAETITDIGPPRRQEARSAAPLAAVRCRHASPDHLAISSPPWTPSRLSVVS